MPGPGNKSKKKSKPKGSNPPNTAQQTSASGPTGSNSSTPTTMTCLTLEEDETTRCDQPATHGHPRRDRCKKHQGQYVKMYKKYKQAAQVVDQIRQIGSIPTKEQINRFTEVKVLLEKARFLRTFLEAIRIERIGRDIHGRRFFLKIDDGHKMRLKVLAKEMIKGLDVLDGLQSRAFEIYLEKNPRPEWSIPKRAEGEVPERRPFSSEDLLAASEMPDVRGIDNLKTSISFQTMIDGADTDVDVENVDLIDLEIRSQKAKMLYAFEFVLDPDFMLKSVTKSNSLKPDDPQLDYIRQKSLTLQKILQQYALRIIFYEPTLFIKSIGKVSFKDFLLSEDVTLEDLALFALLFREKMRIGLLWLKDSIVEALTMIRQGTAANVGHPKNRIKMLDGWIFNVAHVKEISNEAWSTIIEAVEPPADVENRFVRLCNTYDDLIGFLSFGALGHVPPPSFCRDAVAYRNHLSLAGVIIADMVSSPKPSGALPTNRRAKTPGCIVWGEIETRAYIFGAVKNEPDLFAESFLKEIKARPDLFHYVIQSESDPMGKVETSYGPFPQIRAQNFEAPLPTSPLNRPTGHGDWIIGRSAVDILHGKDEKALGYLTELRRGRSAGWFFHFKKFQVKYFVVIDPVPNRQHKFLAQQLAWVALRMRGYGTGEYEATKYAKASDAFFDKCAAERLAWMPASAGTWTTTKMSK